MWMSLLRRRSYRQSDIQQRTLIATVSKTSQGTAFDVEVCYQWNAGSIAGDPFVEPDLGPEVESITALPPWRHGSQVTIRSTGSQEARLPVIAADRCIRIRQRKRG